MTREEKAKAYDEALEWMRKVYPTLTGADKEDAEHYFPGLKVSEDEKIRKDIVAAVEMYGDFTQSRKEEIYAYLEKQKEPRDYRKLYKGVSQSEWFKESEDEKMINGLQGFLSAFGSDYFGTGGWQKFDDWLEKQKEQKPVENSGKELLYVSNKSYNIGYRDGKREAESKQEWSEADEVYLEYALWCVEKAEKSCKDDEDKGACWSAKRWLKSLRPSWKPTEVHLSALLAIISDPNNIGSQTCQLALTDLYEQLKKL